MKDIYLDNSSTSFPKAEGIGQVVSDFIENNCFNINRGNYTKAYDVGYKIIETRMLLKELFNAKSPKEVIFTAGITQAINMVLDGLLKENDHVITTSMEHNSVVRVLEYLKKTKNISYSIVQANEKGYINPNEFEKYINSKTRAIIVNHVSNVIGSVLDIEKIGQITRMNKLVFIVDSAQSAGHLSIDIQRDNIDILCFNGHKGLLGIQGVGGFIIDENLKDDVDSTNVGGSGSKSDQLTMPDFLPDKYEAGTLNLPGIIALNHALKYIDKIGISTMHEKEVRLANYFKEKLKNVSNIKVYESFDGSETMGIVSLSFMNIDNAKATQILNEEYNIMVRCGLHCAFLAHQTIGSYPLGTIRFSFGYTNTFEQLDTAINAIKVISNK